MKGLAVGRIVHVVNDEGEHEPAIITLVNDKDNGIICCVVHGLYQDRREYCLKVTEWHWPEYVE